MYAPDFFVPFFGIVLSVFADPMVVVESGEPAAVPPVAAAASDFEPLPRGPIHEAFAEPVVFDPTPGVVVTKRPPDPVEEIAPESKPAGEDVHWMPGYWAWDDELNDFIWVSGFWRVVPPDTQWVPGYWIEVPGEGFQWVSGYWGSRDGGQTNYLPPPPASLESGPSTDPPGPDYFWAPGYWDWYGDRYVWCAGCWWPSQDNWLWNPPRYTWTPRGYVCVPGYWDYPLARRGLLYAPVRFRPGIYGQVGFSYSPCFAVNMGLLVDHLFVRPQWNHYYFGNYHGARYVQSGVYPWFSLYAGRRSYDPIYAYYRHHHDRDWDDRLRAGYLDRERHDRDRHVREEFDRERPDWKRPSADRLGRQPEAGRTPGGRSRTDIPSLVGRPEAPDLARDLGLKMEKISPERREEIAAAARATRQSASQRRAVEQLDRSAVTRGNSRTRTAPGGADSPLADQLPRQTVDRFQSRVAGPHPEGRQPQGPRTDRQDEQPERSRPGGGRGDSQRSRSAETPVGAAESRRRDERSDREQPAGRGRPPAVQPAERPDRGPDRQQPTVRTRPPSVQPAERRESSRPAPASRGSSPKPPKGGGGKPGKGKP